MIINESYRRLSDEFIDTSYGLIIIPRDVFVINKNSKKILSDFQEFIRTSESLIITHRE